MSAGGFCALQSNGGLNSDQKGLTEMGWIRTTASKGEKSGGEGGS